MFEHYLAALLSLRRARDLADPTLVTELFPQLDRELDAWKDDHGWLYR